MIEFITLLHYTKLNQSFLNWIRRIFCGINIKISEQPKIIVRQFQTLFIKINYNYYFK